MPNLGKHLDIQVHKACKSPYYFNSKWSSPRYIIVKLSKIKDNGRILKASRDKDYDLQSNPIRLSVDFSDTLQPRRE